MKTKTRRFKGLRATAAATTVADKPFDIEEFRSGLGELERSPADALRTEFPGDELELVTSDRLDEDQPSTPLPLPRRRVLVSRRDLERVKAQFEAATGGPVKVGTVKL